MHVCVMNGLQHPSVETRRQRARAHVCVYEDMRQKPGGEKDNQGGHRLYVWVCLNNTTKHTGVVAGFTHIRSTQLLASTCTLYQEYLLSQQATTPRSTSST